MKKKEGIMRRETADKLVVVLFFITGFLTSIYDENISANALGVCFLIAAVYGAVCVLKKKKFLF